MQPGLSWAPVACRAGNAGGDVFVIENDGGETIDTRIMCHRRRVAPKSGKGRVLARSLGHSITPTDEAGGPFPSLVPLLPAQGHWLTSLSGITLETTLDLRTSTGKRLKTFTGSTLLDARRALWAGRAGHEPVLHGGKACGLGHGADVGGAAGRDGGNAPWGV